MNTKLLLAAVTVFAAIHTNIIYSQTSQIDEPRKMDHSYKPLTLKLSEDGTKYMRMIIWHQFWGSFKENNPGTLGAGGQVEPTTLDFGLRRSRMLWYAQISPKFLILSHIGINNQTFINGGAPNEATGLGKKPQVFIHDAWTEYQLVENKLYIGAGLHYWNGISRITSASTLNFMIMDAPIFNWATIERHDQFARQFGVYAKGQLGRFDYRLAVNKPYFINLVPAGSANHAAIEAASQSASYQGYINYMFKDKENNKLPFFVGSYLGSREVLNIGAGFYFHPEATESRTNGTAQRHDIRLLGLDLFYEKPLNKEKGTLLSLYSVLFNYDFGKDYIRNVGIMNVGRAPAADQPGFADRVFNGPGNAQPLIGTGNIWYTTIGYGLPHFANDSQFMPYFAFTYKNFEALNDPSSQIDIGLNYFINGHHSKITLQYSTRPVYDLDRNLSKSASQFTIQTHFFL